MENELVDPHPLEYARETLTLEVFRLKRLQREFEAARFMGCRDVPDPNVVQARIDSLAKACAILELRDS